jgi:CBS domain-containing protein
MLQCSILNPFHILKTLSQLLERESVKSIAETMVKYKIGSVVIEKNHLPIGIITDKDLRSKIATGMFAVNATADQIMSAPVYCKPVCC